MSAAAPAIALDALGDPLSGSYPRYAGKGLQVLMDATNRCNLRCVMCHFAHDSSQREPLCQWTPEFLERIERDVFSRAVHVQVSTGTEPLMWSGFPLLLGALRRARVPLFEMITNGQLLTRELAERIVASGMKRVQLSLEGASRASYEAIRVGADFDRFVRGVELLNEAKLGARSARPHLQFNITLMRRTAGDLKKLLRLARRLGVEDLDLRHVIVLDGLGMESESFLRDKARFNRLMARTRRRARRLGLHIVLAPESFRLEPACGDARRTVTPDRSARDPQSTEHGESPARRVAPGWIPAAMVNGEPTDAPLLPSGPVCWAPWRQVYLAPDGRVLPCAFWYTKEAIGDLRCETFEEIWEGPGYRALRWRHLTGLHGVNCGQCPLRGIGRVDDEAAHFAHDHLKLRGAGVAAG
jgi:radical SAM protein with 4Fe4S-binding SPASM domain